MSMNVAIDVCGTKWVWLLDKKPMEKRLETLVYAVQVRQTVL